MQRIYDNISNELKVGLREGLEQSISADFCSGYFNISGFDLLWDLINKQFTGNGNSCCRILVGRNTKYNKTNSDTHKTLIEEFIASLRTGTRDHGDKLERLKYLIKLGKLSIKLSTSNLVHAKLYLFHNSLDRIPSLAIIGSSNLSYYGLVKGQELNVVVEEEETCLALQKRFESQWSKADCFDISKLIAWADYKEITEEDLHSLASICQEYGVESLIDGDGIHFDIPEAFLYDKKGMENGINPDFLKAVSRIFQEKALDELYFPCQDSEHYQAFGEFPYAGISIMDYMIESFFDPCDPNYENPEIAAEIERLIAKDKT